MLLLMSLFLAALCEPPQAAPSNSCMPTVVGLDASCANTFAEMFLGESTAQTFQAELTRIRRITVWRVADEETLFVALHLYILGVDASGIPDIHNVLLDGPLVSAPYGDGIHPIRFDFVLDPPLNLPRPGEYAFALKTSPCESSCDLLGSESTRPRFMGGYSGGYIWHSGRSDCSLRGYGPNTKADLDFEIEFCSGTTPTRARSWGALKIIYR